MFETISLFDSMELDDTNVRVASRRALALADNRVDRNLGAFLRAARSEEDFAERLALVADDFTGLVLTASEETGYEFPERIATTLREHYRIAAQEESRKEAEKKKKNWIQDAVKRPGQLHRDLGVSEGDKIPESKLEEAEHSSDPKERERAQFAENMKGLRKKKKSTEDKQSAPLVPSKTEGPQDTAAQIDNASRLVPCPECGGEGQTETGQNCPKCKGKGKVPNFGDSIVDDYVTKDSRTADDHGNTGLGGPEPEINKKIWNKDNLKEPYDEWDDIGNATRAEKDIVSPIPARNTHPLSEIGEVHAERQDLPANDGDAGFGDPKVKPNTERRNLVDQATPVTRETISAANPLVELLGDEWPADTVVQAAFK